MKKLLIITFLVIAAVSSKAQFGGKTGMGSVWHYPGQIGVELGIKRSPIGWLYAVSGSQYLQSNSYVKASIFYDQGNFERVKYQSTGISAIYFYSPYSIQETVFFNIGLGVTGNHDKVSNFYQKPVTGFNYGLIGGVEVEASIADYLMIIGSGTQRYLKKDAYGRSRFEIGLGIKYLIN